MKIKRVVRRARADRDIEEAIDRYLEERADAAARGFVECLQRTLNHISRFSGSGSPKYGIELDIDGLRSPPMQRYPYVVFYIDHEEAVEIVRVLHGQRDIPSSLA